MATPRKRWVRIDDQILRDPWPRDVKLTGVLLRAWLNQRWARDGLTPEEACDATLSRAALAEITGRSQLAPARRALRALSEREPLSIETLGEFTRIRWPKFAESLGSASGTRARAGSGNAPTDTDTDTDIRSPNEEGFEEVVSGLLGATGQLVPDALSRKDRETFSRWLHRKLPPLWDDRLELERACLDYYRTQPARAARVRSWLAACEGWAKGAWERRSGQQAGLWPAPVRRRAGG